MIVPSRIGVAVVSVMVSPPGTVEQNSQSILHVQCTCTCSSTQERGEGGREGGSGGEGGMGRQ